MVDSSRNAFTIRIHGVGHATDSSETELESFPLFVFMCAFAEPRCFNMVRYEAYMLVDLLPPFLKTYEESLDTKRGRHLSDETTSARLEITVLLKLTRDINAHQVALLFAVPSCWRDMRKLPLTSLVATLFSFAGKRHVVFECAR